MELAKNILHSEPAAVVGGLLTVHREAPVSIIAFQSIIDGTLASAATATLLANGHPNIGNMALISACTRAAIVGSIYIKKRITNS